MVKINYTKAEHSLMHSLDKIFLKNLTELAAIATQAQEGDEPLNTEEVDQILKSFRAELKKLKMVDMDLYQQLELTPEQEQRFSAPGKDFTREDWLKLIELNDQIVKINLEVAKSREITKEDEERVAKERLEHKNKRFNVRKGWLPLH